MRKWWASTEKRGKPYGWKEPSITISCRGISCVPWMMPTSTSSCMQLKWCGSTDLSRISSIRTRHRSSDSMIRHEVMEPRSSIEYHRMLLRDHPATLFGTNSRTPGLFLMFLSKSQNLSMSEIPSTHVIDSWRRKTNYKIDWTFAYQEVKGVKEVKELRRMFCCLKTMPKRLLS